MRTAILLAAGTVLTAAGCAGHIAASGTDLATLETREQVRVEFGPPVASGTVDGKAYEDFRTRRKVADANHRVISTGLISAYTYGSAEIVLFPTECFMVAARSLLGQDVRFVYDESGRVTAVLRDGEYLVGDPRFPYALGGPLTAPNEKFATPGEARQTPPAPDPDPPR